MPSFSIEFEWLQLYGWLFCHFCSKKKKEEKKEEEKKGGGGGRGRGRGGMKEHVSQHSINKTITCNFVS